MLILVLTLGIVCDSFSQMAISGGIFAENPARYNGRMVTIKNVRLNLSAQNRSVGVSSVGPAGSGLIPQGSSAVAATTPSCLPPKGFNQVDIVFIEKPDYRGCFFMSEALYNQCKKEVKGKTSVDVQITFRGDNRTGFNIESYRLLP